MSNEGTALSTRNEPTDLVNFKIVLNGNPIKSEYGVLSLNVVKIFNKISSAKIIIADGDPSAKDFRISSEEDGLKPGSEVEISMGYHSKNATVFKGIITRHGIKSGKGKVSVLTIEAKDKAIKLAIGRKNSCFVNQKDSDIIKSICGKYGITTDISATSPQHKEMVQYNAMDWDFIVSRAEMNGMLVLTDDNKLVVKPPDTNKAASREVLFGTDVIEFESEIDATSQLKNIKTHAWNYVEQKIEDSPEASIQFKESGNLKGDALAESLGVKEYDLYHPGNLKNDELKSWSDARLLKSRLAKASGRIRIKGTTEIKPGDVITLTGFSKRFNGNVFVTGYRHSYDKSAWETEIQFGLPDQWFYEREGLVEKPASGLLPGINGLQIGIVIQLENDPDQQDRVKIRLPLVDAHEGVWARMASLDAGKNRGAFFRPEVNDEVVVGFLNDDPRHAIILGMLNSGKHPAPLEGKDTNHEKGFITRSEMKFIFNDEKKSVSIETPKGKKILIDEDGDSVLIADEHNNKITLDANGVTIESAKDIALKASSGKIKMEGMNIEGKASAKFSAEGSASATLQSSGQTVVKGSIVNIN